MRKLLHGLVWAKRHLVGQIRAPEFHLVRPYLEAGDVCFDVGAHGGSWSVPLSRAAAPGRVYAFEALPYYADVLRSTLRLMGRANVEVVNVAVSDANSTLEIVWRDARGGRLTGYTHVLGREEQAAGTIRVPSRTLDSFCDERRIERVRFIKCDVEGAELFVYRGAERLIARSRPLVFGELNQEWCRRYAYEPGDVFAFFDRHDYRALKTTSAGGLEPTSAPSYPGDGDVLFLPREMN